MYTCCNCWNLQFANYAITTAVTQFRESKKRGFDSSVFPHWDALIGKVMKISEASQNAPPPKKNNNNNNNNNRITLYSTNYIQI